VAPIHAVPFRHRHLGDSATRGSLSRQQHEDGGRDMTEDGHFLAPRPCLHPALPEHALAADLLSQAVDAILHDDTARARELVERANIRMLFDHTTLVMSGKDKRIERRRKVEAPIAATAKSAGRMPPAAVIRALYARDFWHCRFCSCRVVPPEMRMAMRAILPGAISWSESEGFHGGFFALSASVDHIIPHSAGGSNDEANLVTACWSCQFGRGAYSLAELGLMDPRARAPVEDGWDGLTRLLSVRQPNRPEKAQQGGPASSPRPARVAKVQQAKPPSLLPPEWIAALDPGLQEPFRRLIRQVEACADLGMTCHSDKVLIVRMSVGDINLAVFGILPDGRVEIPWSIDGEKMAFRPFAEMLAAAIPGAVVYETPKLWNISMPANRRITLQELLQAEPDFRDAWVRLRSDMMKSQALHAATKR
jgi:5-methylcytosine-specific restriction endonuclease McrA